MKIKLSVFVCVAALFFVFGGALDCFGQQDVIAGGFTDADVKNPDVVAAANYAVKKRSKTLNAVIDLVSVERARTQVVAGMNYEVCMELDVKRKTDKKADRQFAKALVYRNLKNKFSLTNWAYLKALSDCQAE